MVLFTLIIICSGLPFYSYGNKQPVEQQAKLSFSQYYLNYYHAEQNRNFEKAASNLSQIIDQIPENKELKEKLLIFYIVNGDYHKAAEIKQSILKETPNNYLAYLLDYIALFYNKKYDDILNKKNTIDEEIYITFFKPVILAWSHAGLGNEKEALEMIDMASAEGYYYSLLNEQKILLLLFFKKYNEAKLLLEKTYEKTVASRKTLITYLANLPKEMQEKEAPEIFKKLEQGNKVAIHYSEFNKAINQKSLLKDNPQMGIFHAFLSLSQILFDNEQNLFSLLYNRLAYFVSPDNDEALYLLGLNYQAVKLRKKANEVFLAIQKEEILHLPAQFEILDFYEEGNQHRKALHFLKEITKQYPQYSSVFIEEGDFYRLRKQYRKALRSYQKAFNRIGKIEEKDWALLYARGITYERLNQWQKAEKDLKKALEFRPNQPYVLNYLGYSWIEKGMHLDKAIKMVEKAVELKPFDGFITDSLGWALYQKGDYEKAIKVLERAVLLEPSDPILNDHLGDAYWKGSRKIEAKFQWQRALNLKPESELEEKIIHKIKYGL